MKKILNKKIEIILSLLFSIFTIFGESYKKIDSWDYVFNNPFRSILLFIIYFIIFYICILIFERLFYKININNKTRNFSIKLFDNHPVRNAFIIILLFWLPIIIIKYPGSPGWDFHHILNQYYQRRLTQHFPILYTLPIIFIIKIGIKYNFLNFSLFIITIIHMLILLISLSITFHYLKKWKTNYKFRYFILLFYSINPIFLFYSSTIYHDVIYSAFTLIYILLLTDIVVLKNKFSNKQLLLLFIVSLCICFTRKNGIFIVIPSNLYIIFKYVIKFDKKKLKVVMLILPIILLFVVDDLFTIRYYKTSVLEALSIPIQNISRYSNKYHEDITYDQKILLNQFLDYDLAGKLYNPTIVDKSRNEAGNYYATKEQTMYFFKIWFELFFNHPNVYIESFINNTYQLYYPFENTTYFFVDVKEEKSLETIVNFKQPKILKKYRENLKTAIYKFEEIPLLKYIDDPGIYTWIFIILVVIVIKNKKSILPLLPGIMTILCCLAGPTIDYNTRYVFPVIFSIFPLLAFYSLEKCVKKEKNSFKC